MLFHVVWHLRRVERGAPRVLVAEDQLIDPRMMGSMWCGTGERAAADEAELQTAEQQFRGMKRKRRARVEIGHCSIPGS
jgi:hypothetical protein